MINNKSPDLIEEKNQSIPPLEVKLLNDLSLLSKKIWLATFMMGAIICYFAHDSAPTAVWLSWLTLLYSVSTIRYLIVNASQGKSRIRLKNKVVLVSSVTLLAGLIHASALYFFPSFTLAEKSIQTIMILGFSSGSVASTSGYKPFYLTFTLPTVILLSIMWIFTPIDDVTLWAQVGVGLLITCFTALNLSLANNYYSFFTAAYDSSIHLEKALHDSVIANKSKTRFFASASHDLKQPIHTLSLLSTTLSMQSLDEKSSIVATHIETAITNLASQMDTLLDISKIDAGLIDKTVTNINLCKLLEKLHIEYGPVCESNSLSLTLINKTPSAKISSDIELVERIIRNIISKSIKYTETGGIEIRLDEVSDKWLLTIKDTGQGMSQEQLKHIFEEFYQVDNSQRNRQYGMGLGLSIVQRLTSFLNIPIDIESTLDAGTTVSLEFEPCEDDINDRTSNINNMIESDLSTKELRILCIDDEEDIRIALQLLLTEIGYQVDLASGTEQAISHAHKNQPNLVIADYRLSDNDNGITTIKSLRELYPDLPAILISADKIPNPLDNGALNDITILQKPVNTAKLKSTLDKLMGNTGIS